ncbi:MAG: YdeI/OmpD-associated family protein [Ruminococcus sp.]|nr:YdeI/OmpD-associated family protein [Ruminococcus sp.]
MDQIDLPMGFGMALAQNEKAMAKFESLSEQEKRNVIERTHSVKSKKEMRELVDGLGK